MNLYAARYSEDLSTFHENITDAANIGIRWALPGGIHKIEVTVRVRSRADARNRFSFHIGQALVIYDDYLDTPIAMGWIYEGKLDGLEVTYVAQGAWARHFDSYETDLPASPASTTTGAYLANTILANHVLGGNLDTTNVDTTNTPNVGTQYKLKRYSGERPGDIIKDLLKMGTTTAGEVLDYWLAPRPFIGTTLQYPAAYLQPRKTTDSVSWQVWRRDISTMSLSRDAYNMANDITIYYTPATTLSADANGNSQTISVTSATDLNEGDELEIEADDGHEYRSTIHTISGTTVTLIDKIPGSATPFASSGNTVRRIDPLEAGTNITDAAAQAGYWTRERVEARKKYDDTQADAWGNALLTAYAYPTSRASFVIGSGLIKDGYGQLRPPWRLLINPGIVRFNDLFVTANIFSTQLDSLQSFRVVAADYDHRSRRLRIVPDSTDGDQRLDVILQQLSAVTTETSDIPLPPPISMGQMVRDGVIQ